MRRATGKALLCLSLAAGFAAPSAAQEVVKPHLLERLQSGLSQNNVAITANFSGSEIFVYGAIERNRFLDDTELRPDVIVAISGPSAPVIVRKKKRVAGIWMNVAMVRIASAPSFYTVASTRPLSKILNFQDDSTYRIGLDKAVLLAGTPFSSADPEEFRKAVIRIKVRDGLYREEPSGVTLHGASLFQVSVHLPANIIEGDYQARVFLVRDHRVVDVHRTAIAVRKSGFERTAYRMSQDRPLLYGVLALVVAVAAGWAASEIFRRALRR